MTEHKSYTEGGEIESEVEAEHRIYGGLIMGPEVPDWIKACCAFFVHLGETQLATRILERYHWYALNQPEALDDGE